MTNSILGDHKGTHDYVGRKMKRCSRRIASVVPVILLPVTLESISLRQAGIICK